MSEVNFFQKIYKVVSKIPKGKVMSYGQVAALCGNARAARVVGWALRALPADTDIPWQRVVNFQGFLTISNQCYSADEQKNRLEQEKIKSKCINGLWKIDLDKYLANIS